jgi:hypothetical protein
MYRMIRQATLKNASYAPKAMGWTAEFTGWFNKEYDLNMKTGMGMFNKSDMFWTVDFESMAAMEETWGKILQDKKYWEFIEAGKDFWVDGSLQDNLFMALDV